MYLFTRKGFLVKKKEEIWCLVNYLNIKTNMYAVSNYGRLRNIITQKELHPWLCKNGYRYGTFMCDDNSVITIGMHVIVAEHFIKKPKSLLKLNEPLVPNHLDFDKENNYFENLEWVTYAMNNEYNRIHNHWKTCDSAPNAKSNNLLIHKICELMEQGYLNKEIFKLLDIPINRYTKSLLTRIRTGKQWKEISKNYNITNKNTLRNNDTKLIESICQMLEKGYSHKQMRGKLGIPSDKDSKRKFKCLVYGIKTRRNYKDISEKYHW